MFNQLISASAPLEIPIPQEGIQVVDFGKVQVGEASIIHLNLINHSDAVQELRIAQPLRSGSLELCGENVESSIAISPNSSRMAGLRLHLPKEGRIVETLVLETQQGLEIRLTLTAIGQLESGTQAVIKASKLRAFGKAQRVLVQENDENIDTQTSLSFNESTIYHKKTQAAQQQPMFEHQQLERPPTTKPNIPSVAQNQPSASIMAHETLPQFPQSSMDLSSPVPVVNNRNHSRPATWNINLNSSQEGKPLSSIDRQEASLCLWLNTMISTGEESVDAARAVARMRGRLWKIYSQDTELRDSMMCVEQRLDSGQLKAKNTEAALSGIREAASVRKALAAFHPLWLRLAAEIAVGRPSKTMPLDVFIKNHVLADKALLLQHKGVSTPAYWAQLGTVVAKRMLLIVALLDRVGTRYSSANYPLVFKPGCGISSSSAALQAAVGSLLGEAEVARHLGRLGFKVSYVQTPRQEIDFRVNNLAIDMRDGLRLCRLVDQAIEEDSGKSLFESARFPAVKRPDRLYNIELALKALNNAGMDTSGIYHCNSAAGSTLAAAIVNGDRSATLSLMWCLILQHDLPRLANTTELNMEIDHLGLRTSQLDAITIEGDLATDAGRCIGNIAALLHWMSAVTSKYGVHVSNFGQDVVSDGSAFCILVHHYLGDALMPLASISKSSLFLNHDAAQNNFALLQTAIETLGGVPMIITSDDFLDPSSSADQRAVTLFTATLCHRLIESNREHRAAMVIQRRWRQRGAYKPGTARQHLHSWIAAATIIQRCVRVHLLRLGLQKFIQEKRELEAAVRIQAVWRGFVQRRQFLKHLEENSAATVIQRHIRGMLARQEAAARRQHKAALHELAVQQTKKRMADLAQVMAQYAVRTAAAKKIQACWLRYRCRVRTRAMLAEKAAVEEEKAARRAAAGDLIASWGPTFRDRLWFMKARRAAVVIQKNVKTFLAVLKFEREKASALKIQTVYRGYVVRFQHVEAMHLQGIRNRLRAAGAVTTEVRSSQRTIGARTMAALEALSSCKGRSLPSFAILQDLAYCTEASLTSCTMVVETGVLSTLLSGAVASGRDKKTLAEPLKWALQCIFNVCSCRSLVNNVFYTALQNGSIIQLVDLLQQLREREEPFLSMVAILERLTKDAQRGSAVREQKPELVSRLEGIARLLNHKKTAADIYLTKLEAQKGSDVSARQATRGLISVTKQLNALGRVLENVGAQDLNEILAVGKTASGVDRRASDLIVAKNTIVRAALAEISNKN